MAYNLKDKLWSFFASGDTYRDLLKDGNGKGTMQRFVETHGEYYDDYLKPLTEDLVANTVDPDTCLVQFLEYLEYQTGADAIVISTAEATRRKIIRYAQRFVSRKGTVPGHTIMFSMIGLTATLTTIDTAYGLDSPITLDDDNRRLDSNCPTCGAYTIDLVEIAGYGFVFTSETLDAINNIIAYNKPTDAIIQNITLNGVALAIWISTALQNGEFKDGGEGWILRNIVGDGTVEFSADDAIFQSAAGEGSVDMISTQDLVALAAYKVRVVMGVAVGFSNTAFFNQADYLNLPEDPDISGMPTSFTTVASFIASETGGAGDYEDRMWINFEAGFLAGSSLTVDKVLLEPYTVPGGTLILEENFDDNSNGWAFGSLSGQTLEITGGKLHFACDNAGTYGPTATLAAFLEIGETYTLLIQCSGLATGIVDPLSVNFGTYTTPIPPGSSDLNRIGSWEIVQSTHLGGTDFVLTFNSNFAAADAEITKILIYKNP